jgi:hypothetical protein
MHTKKEEEDKIDKNTGVRAAAAAAATAAGGGGVRACRPHFKTLPSVCPTPLEQPVTGLK